MGKIIDLIQKEKKRQAETLMMIPSENYSYPEVRAAVGSVLMHKYSEGQPYKRYYQGNEFIDEIEDYCNNLALEVFGLSSNKWTANVQAYSGSPANLAVYNALLNPGDKILSMYLPDGGHLSHGWNIPSRKITLVSKIYKVDFYRVNTNTQIFDYKDIEKKAKKMKPKLIISGGTAYTREIDHKIMGEIAKSVGAYYLADVAHEAGLIAAGTNKSPFPYANIVTMTTHKTLRGPRGAIIISKKPLSKKVDKSIFPGLQGGPHNNTIAAIAICLEKAKTKEFKNYASQTIKNAKKLAANLSESEYKLVSGGTDKHSVLVDLRNKNSNGWFVALALEKAGIVVNRNAVPSDTNFPYYPSGIRLGTPAITARGMKEKEIDLISKLIDQVIDHVGKREVLKNKQMRNKAFADFKKEIAKDKFLINISKRVKTLCNSFPIK